MSTKRLQNIRNENAKGTSLYAHIITEFLKIISQKENQNHRIFFEEKHEYAWSKCILFEFCKIHTL